MLLDLIWAVNLKKSVLNITTAASFELKSDLKLGDWDVDTWDAAKKVTGWTSKWSPVLWISQVILKDQKVGQRKVGWYLQMRLERRRPHHGGPCEQLCPLSKVQKIVPGLSNCATRTPVQVWPAGLSVLLAMSISQFVFPPYHWAHVFIPLQFGRYTQFLCIS